MRIEQFFDNIFEGNFDQGEVKTTLEEMHQRGETIQEIVAGAKSMIYHMNAIKPNVEECLLDIVGTGGDGKSSINVSTIAAFVAAGTGCKVAKHCNRGMSSKFGSVDLLEELGINVNNPPEQTEKIIEEIGIGFMYAPLYHPAMKNIKEIRKEIPHRTIFNLLGPLTNPANAQTRLIGAYSLEAAEKIAYAAQELNMKKIWAVHSNEGLDEISISAPTSCFTNNLDNKEINFHNYFPENYIPSKGISDIEINSAKQSSEICNKILYNKELTEKEEIIKQTIIENTSVAIYLNGKSSIYLGIKLANESIEGGAAANKLEQLIEATN